MTRSIYIERFTSMTNRASIISLLLGMCMSCTQQKNASSSYNEIRNAKDGSILIEIPSGKFTMGSNDGANNEKPVHTVYLDRYFIGKYDVTVGQFRRFVAATGYVTDAEKDDKKDGATISINNSWQQKKDVSWKNPYFKQSENSPVVLVSWNDANAYCTWAGLRLPTEAEWEKAARGTDGRKYPWGDVWDSTKCNSAESKRKGTTPIGVFLAGVSPYGCYDIAGNVEQWCNDWYDSDYYDSSPRRNPTGPSERISRVMRGGCWDGASYFCRTTQRSWVGPGIRYLNDVGFRVAR